MVIGNRPCGLQLRDVEAKVAKTNFIDRVRYSIKLVLPILRVSLGEIHKMKQKISP